MTVYWYEGRALRLRRYQRELEEAALKLRELLPYMTQSLDDILRKRKEAGLSIKVEDQPLTEEDAILRYNSHDSYKP